MAIDKAPTDYASAERASMDVILVQYREISVLPNVSGLLDSMPVIALILNKQRQIVYANKTTKNFLEIDDVKSILGKRPGELVHCIFSGDSEKCCGTTKFCKVCGAVNAIIASQEGKSEFEECRITTKNGDAFDFQVCTAPFLSAEEEFTIFSLVDISSEKRRRVLERIFFHDILNTLESLRGYTSLLKEEQQPDEEIRCTIDKLALTLIEEIKSQQMLQAAESNDLQVKPDALHTKLILQQVINPYRKQDVSQNRVITISPDIFEEIFQSDGLILSRVLTNMLKNALESSSEGETITLGCDRQGDKLQFWVHNPKYISPDIQLQIFQRSFSTKGCGRGLGTYSIKLLTERYLQGSVSFASFPDKGTTFEIILPMELQTEAHQDS